ncbi:MAG: replicative DNA helicase, partial [Tepidisphaeraceae bacterium]
MSEPLRIGETAAQFDKLPPHSLIAEQCLIASMMLDKELVGQVLAMVERDAFYLADHQIIYGIILSLYEANRPVDAVILREELLKRGQLDEIGGTAYLAEVLNTVPSAANGMHYAAIVRDKFLLRTLITSSNDALREAYAPHESVDVIIDRAEKRIFEIANKKISGAASPLGDIAMEVYEMLEGSGRRGLETGFYELDDMLNGLQPGEMIIVAARPSMGKTAFAMNLIEAMANGNHGCAVFSLEMSKQQLAQRMMCSRAQIDAQRVRKGLLSAQEYQRLAMMVNEMNKMPIWVDDSPGLTPLELRAKARRLKQQHDIKAIMIDYMQ